MFRSLALTITPMVLTRALAVALFGGGTKETVLMSYSKWADSNPVPAGTKALHLQTSDTSSNRQQMQKRNCSG